MMMSAKTKNVKMKVSRQARLQNAYNECFAKNEPKTQNISINFVEEADGSSMDNEVEDEEDSGEITDDDSDDSNQNQPDPATRLEALFEAATSEKNPVLLNATLALDEAAQTLNRMRSETTSTRERK